MPGIKSLGRLEKMIERLVRQLDLTGTTISGNKLKIETIQAAKVLTASDSGKIFQVNNSAASITLPATPEQGMHFKFVNFADGITVIGGLIFGSALLLQDGGDTAVHFETAAANNKISLNGSTTGGTAIGDFVEMTCLDADADSWYVRVVAAATGTEATPFSTV